MPRIEVHARWKHPESGDPYESEIGSIILEPDDVFDPDKGEAIAHRVFRLMADAAKYEQGPITDMARNLKTGESYSREKGSEKKP
jgi:hypothetical protein